jgi:hypothetical protein
MEKIKLQSESIEPKLDDPARIAEYEDYIKNFLLKKNIKNYRRMS